MTTASDEEGMLTAAHCQYDWDYYTPDGDRLVGTLTNPFLCTYDAGTLKGKSYGGNIFVGSWDSSHGKTVLGRSGTGYAPRRSAEAAGFDRPGTVASGPPFVPCCSPRAGTSPTASNPNGRSRCLCDKRLPTPFDTSESPHPLKRSSPCKGTAN